MSKSLKQSLGFIIGVAVLPDYQRRGIGKQLVFPIFEKDQNAEKLLLITEMVKKNYEKIRFQPSLFQYPDYPENFTGYEFHRNLLNQFH